MGDFDSSRKSNCYTNGKRCLGILGCNFRGSAFNIGKQARIILYHTYMNSLLVPKKV